MTMNLLSRRSALAAVSALLLVACGDNSSATGGQTAAVSQGDHVIGSADAPVTVIEYASPTCPACKYFHDDVLPTLKTEYIDTGKVRFVYREYPVHQDLDVPAYALAMCAGEDKFFDVLDDLFERQDNVIGAAQNGALKMALQTIGKRHGIETDAQFDACMSNRDYRQALADKYQVATEKWNVTSTPSFIIDGKTHRFEGRTRTVESFSEYLDELIAKAAPAEAAAPAEDTTDAAAPEQTEQ